MKIRLIIQSDRDGIDERVHFTDIFNTPVAEFVIQGYDIRYDDIIEVDLPIEFPIGFDLKRL